LAAGQSRAKPGDSRRNGLQRHLRAPGGSSVPLYVRPYEPEQPGVVQGRGGWALDSVQSVRSAQDLATRAPWHAASAIARQPPSPRPALTGKNYRSPDTFSAGTNACLEVETLPRPGLKTFFVAARVPSGKASEGCNDTRAEPVQTALHRREFYVQKNSELYKWNSEKVNRRLGRGGRR
jgi:hypothetical protein